MWRRIAFGNLRYRPDDFWRMSLLEWNDALDGLAQKNGADMNEPFTGEDLDELMEKYPDGRN